MRQRIGLETAYYSDTKVLCSFVVEFGRTHEQSVLKWNVCDGLCGLVVTVSGC
jgi:hypothetical protein